MVHIQIYSHKNTFPENEPVKKQVYWQQIIFYVQILFKMLECSHTIPSSPAAPE